MAKRTRTTSSESRDIVKFCAFWGLVIAAGLLVVTAILNLVGANLGKIATIFDIISKIAMAIAVAFAAYAYVRNRSIGWKITFWIALIIYVACCVLLFF